MSKLFKLVHKLIYFLDSLSVKIYLFDFCLIINCEVLPSLPRCFCVVGRAPSEAIPSK